MTAPPSQRLPGPPRQAPPAASPRRCFFPPGAFRLTKAPPIFTSPVSVFGEGRLTSVILVDPTLSGAVFSWSEVWMAGNYGPDTIQSLATQKAGVEVRDIAVVGTRATTNRQDAFVFFDRADQVLMRDVDVLHLAGRALLSGVAQREPVAFMRESHFRDLRFVDCGGAGIAVVEFDSQGGGDATNELSIDGLTILEPRGSGLVIRSNGTPVRNIRFSGLRVEGGEAGNAAGDPVQIGDSSLAGNVNNIQFEDTALLNPQNGFSAIRFTAPSLSLAPFQILFQGTIDGASETGRGIVIDAGRDLFFDLAELHTGGVDVTVASAKTVAGPIVLNGFGREDGWTRSIDRFALAAVKKPIPGARQAC
jgi:hypothetical protein